ncbi:ATP-binding protein [Bradyrhizobium aeschynomenes]|uniref:ATP-binding protein n=1 Tax=Bradyrhizobium aeschynomenes TaxID=2734909 RepID=UPI001FEE0905|nr:ATP-binding protein [Bradyrhizobium aeschynomenes]
MAAIAMDAGGDAGGMVSALEQNAVDLDAELGWLAQLIDARFKLYFNLDRAEPAAPSGPPDLSQSPSPYASFLREHACDFAERVALVLALAPHLRPQLLDVFFTRNQTFDRRFAEFGGVRKEPDGDFWPTGETLAFIIGGTDLATRFRLQALFEPDHPFARRGLLRAASGNDEPVMKARLVLSEDALALFTRGEQRRPSFGAHFPAQLIETTLDWSDLVLHPATRQGLGQIESWIAHGHTLMHDWRMAAKLRPGYRSLFYGPPGTGKTMTACLLGKSTGRHVYRVDLSMVVSKFIGETEKNLAAVFNQAEGRNWILLFDEADALFGKRSETRDAHDRYANQEIAFLLQRIESFDGIAILASNLRDNIDDAFARRFESVIYFPVPRPEEREQLWRQGFSPKAQFAGDLDLSKIARDYTLSGGSIMNVIRLASLQSLKDNGRPIGRDDLVAAIKSEMIKEGRAA